MSKQRHVIAIPADLHSGSKVALITGDQWEFVDEGIYLPSESQKIIAQQWDIAWTYVASLLKTKLLQIKPKLSIFVAGDSIEGIHHEQSQLITARRDEQERIHIAAMRRAFELSGFDSRQDELRYISGTSVHDGVGSSSAERIARELLGVDKLDGHVIIDHLRREINGVLLDIAHHGPGLGLRRWTRSNPLRLALQDYYFQCLELNQPIPRYYIRAHRHQYVTTDVRHSISGQITLEGFLLPSWTMKNDFAQTQSVNSLANIGMLIIVVEPDGNTWWHCEYITYDQDKIIKD